ncbi:MAG: nucleoside-diphosphate sugar epimerase/dehydratase [Herbinix sp.]|nr:nucleoside-diphosphate sugar epimerase/dehydratase [Herbinix sp.]
MNLSKYRKEIVFLLDLLIIIIVGITLFLVLPEINETANSNFVSLLPHIFLLILCEAISQYFFKTYDSLWRYAESKEYLIMSFGGFSGYIFYLVVDYYILSSQIPMLFSLATYSISLLGMLLMRLCYRQYRKHGKDKNNRERITLAIIGAGEAGVKLQEEIVSNPKSRYHTICFIDDSVEKIGKRIHNIPVKGPIMNLEKLIMNTPVSEIVIAMPSISPEKQRAILDLCSTIKCRVQILPNTLELLQNNDGEDLWKSVRDIKIEELLGREQITLDNKEVVKFLRGKIVLVTGGGGSIGSELCRQIAKIKPKKLVIVDIYENNAYDIQQELRQLYGDQLVLNIEIASVRDRDKMNQLFDRHRPNIVFHAAAHKHVPLMEDCPEEAIMNNIFGTYNVVQASQQYGVEKFVLISTDKAVNPTSIMGSSKRFCEMILQSMKKASKTEFVAVRFGNVLGSNGSVIPLFQKQIAQGGPVTITDKRIVRYFMTISEAVQLVLQAGSMANNAEIYVLDMGQPVKILELAENLIRMSGHVPYTEIPIIETGLRPGEKLYEELLMNSEELIATANQKIYIEREKNISQKEIKKKLKILTRSLDTKSLTEIKKAFKLVVPTYRDPEEVNQLK